jgi:hypothetical protein
MPCAVVPQVKWCSQLQCVAVGVLLACEVCVCWRWWGYAGAPNPHALQL